MSEWFNVKTYSNRPEAEVGGSLLRANGIKFQIVADDAGGMYPPPFQPTSGVELRVLNEDLEKAKKLLEIE